MDTQKVKIPAEERRTVLEIIRALYSAEETNHQPSGHTPDPQPVRQGLAVVRTTARASA